MNKKCSVCNKEFNVPPSRVNKRKTCSIKCKAATQIGKPAWNKGIKRWWKSFKFSKGSIPWNKNKHGYSTSKKGKIYPLLRGKNSYLWKGGITSINKLERVRFRLLIQKQVFERDNYTCQICGERGRKLQVDHIQSWKDYVELRFNIGNCRTLCMACHYKITFGKPMPPTIKSWGHNLKYAIST
jgi:hypothetical protein